MSDLTRLDLHTSSIAVLTLDHHEHRNALSIAMRDELSDRLDLLGADPDVKVVIIANAGSVFCAGFDLREFERAATDPAFAEILWSSSDRYHRAVATLPIIAIAAVDGPAIAGGFDLAVLCDLRVASTATTFSHPVRPRRRRPGPRALPHRPHPERSRSPCRAPGLGSRRPRRGPRRRHRAGRTGRCRPT